VRIEFVLKSEHVLASKGAWRPTPTQSTCLYYCDVMKLVSVMAPIVARTSVRK